MSWSVRTEKSVIKRSISILYARNYDIPEKEDSVIVVGHIMIDSRPYDVCIPKIRQEDVKIPEKPIGMLKFVALPRLAAIDENDPGFNGWVYPDGRLVSKAKFPNAYSAFGGSFGEETSTHFKIPDIRDFIELNPGLQTQNAIEKKPSNAGLRKHRHSITDITVNGSVEFDLIINGYNTWDQKPGERPEYKYHHGTKNDNSGSYVSP